MKSRDIMTKKVVMVEEEASVAEAVTLMNEKKVSSLIVNRLNEDDSYGIITRRDVVNKVVAEGLDPQKLRVNHIMTKPLLTISPNLSIKHVARLMLYTGVRRMPVSDGHQIIGIVSNSDIFRGFCRYLSDENAFLT
jgi:CBS domain-containing protein